MFKNRKKKLEKFKQNEIFSKYETKKYSKCIIQKSEIFKVQNKKKPKIF